MITKRGGTIRLGLAGGLLMCMIAGCEPETGINYGMNSANVAQHLVRDEMYPLVGFWKLHPSDDFGLVINKGRDGLYTIWFCGPRGSTELESLSPTSVIGDSNFNVLDEDTLEVMDHGGNFQTYARFQ